MKVGGTVFGIGIVDLEIAGKYNHEWTGADQFSSWTAPV